MDGNAVKIGSVPSADNIVKGDREVIDVVERELPITTNRSRSFDDPQVGDEYSRLTLLKKG